MRAPFGRHIDPTDRVHHTRENTADKKDNAASCYVHRRRGLHLIVDLEGTQPCVFRMASAGPTETARFFLRWKLFIPGFSDTEGNE